MGNIIKFWNAKGETTSQSISGVKRSPIRALRHRNYQLFFGGQLISVIGTWMQAVAQAWLVYRLTGSAVLLLPVGFCMIVQMASSNTLIQTMVPDRLRGRVMSVYSMMFMGMAPFGALLAGALAQYLGAPATVAIGGIVCIAGAVLFGLRLTGLRIEFRQLIASAQIADNDPANLNQFASSVVI